MRFGAERTRQASQLRRAVVSALAFSLAACASSTDVETIVRDRTDAWDLVATSSDGLLRHEVAETGLYRLRGGRIAQGVARGTGEEVVSDAWQGAVGVVERDLERLVSKGIVLTRGEVVRLESPTAGDTLASLVLERESATVVQVRTIAGSQPFARVVLVGNEVSLLASHEAVSRLSKQRDVIHRQPTKYRLLREEIDLFGGRGSDGRAVVAKPGTVWSAEKYDKHKAFDWVLPPLALLGYVLPWMRTAEPIEWEERVIGQEIGAEAGELPCALPLNGAGYAWFLRLPGGRESPVRTVVTDGSGRAELDLLPCQAWIEDNVDLAANVSLVVRSAGGSEVIATSFRMLRLLGIVRAQAAGASRN